MGATDLTRLTRREFVKDGFVFAAGAAGLAAGYAAVPDVFARAVYAGKKDGVMNDRVLVMIQLAGGADGLQTVIPMNDSNLRTLRPTLSRAADTALPLGTSGQGLNRSMKGIKALYDQGKVAIVQGVGYPKPNFSHFDSIRIWETADPDRRQQDGWLGKTIASNYDSQGHPLVGCACGTSEVPGALRDLQATLSVVNGQNSFKFNGGDAERAMGVIYNGTPGIYGALFAQLIISGVGAKILHVTLGGWDTHDQEFARHESLMGYVDSAVSAFHADLAAYGMADRVLVATWSEFGRRAQETGSAGTDHGTSAPMLLIGDTVKGGLYGLAPSLNVGRDGNLKYAVDFRAVYQEILESHMKVDASEVLSQRFERIPAVSV
jgi:uncharacterized protein (DUF1501 family)